MASIASAELIPDLDRIARASTARSTRMLRCPMNPKRDRDVAMAEAS